MFIVTDSLPKGVSLDEENRLRVPFVMLDALQDWLAEQLNGSVSMMARTIQADGEKRKMRGKAKSKSRAKAAKPMAQVARKKRRKRDEAAIVQKRLATMAANRAKKAQGTGAAHQGESWPGAQAASQ